MPSHRVKHIFFKLWMIVKNTSLLSTWVPETATETTGMSELWMRGREGSKELVTAVTQTDTESEYYPWMSGRYEGWLRQVTRPARPDPRQGTKHLPTPETGPFGKGLLPLILT